MNEKNKIITVIIALITVIALIVGVSVSESKKSEKQFQEYLALADQKEETVFFLGRPTCGYCVQFTPIIEALSKDYGFKYEYIDTDELSSSKLSRILTKFDIEEESFGTPHLTITKNGEVLANQSGYLEREELFKFLQANNIISADAEYKSEYPNVTMIDYENYKNILTSAEKSIVVLGQSGCSYCSKTLPVLNELAEKHKITINYLNITSLSEEDSEALMTSTTYLKELENFGTPLTLVIESGEVVDTLSGYNDSSVFEEFFSEQKIIK